MANIIEKAATVEGDLPDPLNEICSLPIWEAVRDFGHGPRRYRCWDICTRLSQCRFEYLNPKLGWREVNNHDVRRAMHKFTTENFRDPF